MNRPKLPVFPSWKSSDAPLNPAAVAYAPRQREFEAQWVAQHSGMPQVLYHYTDAAGFLGIVESNQLWASNATFLNDSTEFIYIREVLGEVLDEFVDGDETAKSVASFGRALLDALPEMIDVYVTCFCENGDLLSQWRGYPRSGGGYALGFDREVLLKTSAPRRVIYDPEAQRRIVRDLFSRVTETRKEYAHADAGFMSAFEEDISFNVFYSLAECAWCFKHPAFSEENEWRMVGTTVKDYVGKNKDGEPYTRVRATPTGLLPYMTFSLRNGQDEAKRRALSEVVVGPGRHPDLAAAAARRLLRNVGYESPPKILRRSAVPLRV